MSPHGMTESVVEEAALRWLEGLRHEIQFGPDIAPSESSGERRTYDEAMLPRLRLRVRRGLIGG